MAEYRTPEQIRAASRWMIELMDAADRRSVKQLKKGDITKAMLLRRDHETPEDAAREIWP